MTRSRAVLIVSALLTLGVGAASPLNLGAREDTGETAAEANRTREAVAANAATPETRVRYTAQSADPFEPACGGDASCKAWAAFRKQHPFPYQTIAATAAPGRTLVVILSEPPPSLSRKDLETLVRRAFGRDLLKYAEHRWKIGVDGWVEDVVLTVKWAPRNTGRMAVLDDSLLRDRMALLHVALFGTAAGADLEDASVPLASMPAATDLAPTPAELYAWTADPKVGWTFLDQEGDSPRTLADVMRRGPAGAYEDSQHQLTAFVLPASSLAEIRAAQKPSPALASLFRGFALATDFILGGLLDDDRSVAIVGRTRRLGLQAAAPLRFETFWQLARETRRLPSSPRSRRRLGVVVLIPVGRESGGGRERRHRTPELGQVQMVEIAASSRRSRDRGASARRRCWRRPGARGARTNGARRAVKEPSPRFWRGPPSASPGSRSCVC